MTPVRYNEVKNTTNPQTEQEVTMVIIPPRLEMIKASETHNDFDIGDTATELLEWWGFVIGSYDIDECKQESSFQSQKTQRRREGRYCQIKNERQ